MSDANIIRSKLTKKIRMGEWTLTIVADKRDFHDGKRDYNPRKMRP